MTCVFGIVFHNEDNSQFHGFRAADRLWVKFKQRVISFFYSYGHFRLVSVLLAACAIQGAYACDSCGRECAAACGTRHFRTCCFNYLRKRSGNGPPLGVNYNSRTTATRQDDEVWKRGGIAVYRDYANADDLQAFDRQPESDFDVELVKTSNGNSIYSPGIRIVNES